MDLLDELTSRPLPGDGAMGTRLLALGIARDRCLEALCATDPDLIRRVHDEYLAAGARVIRTNSFGANAVRLAPHGLAGRVSELNWTAAQLAREAAKGRHALVAGSVGPLGLSAAEARACGIDRQATFTDQIGALLDGGAQLIVLETFLDLEEMELALYVKQSLHHCPVLCSFAPLGDHATLPDGTPLAAAFTRLTEAGADLLGINCVDGPAALRLLDLLPAHTLLAAFPSAGLPVNRHGPLEYPASPEDFAATALELARRGVRLIGGCCGTTPSHIAAVAEALETFAPVPPP